MKAPVIQFIIKALGIFVVWYLIYELWLLPDGRLDYWLSLNIIGVSAGILQGMGFDVYTMDRVIGIMGYYGIEIVDGCNGIAAMGLFLGFILAYPGRWSNKLSYIAAGVGIIYLVNILRVMILVITQKAWPAFFDFTHDYSTTAIFYIIIFILWMIWVNYSEEAWTPPRSAPPVQNRP